MPTDPSLKVAPPDPAGLEPVVLLVDDDPALLHLLNRWLAGYGLTIITAGSGVDALTRMLRERVDVIVSDYHMYGMDGLQLLDEVKRRWPATRRILYTGHADSDLVMDAVQHKVLTKQMDPYLVRDAILRASKQRT